MTMMRKNRRTRTRMKTNKDRDVDVNACSGEKRLKSQGS
jgi:hypothetical protein